MISPGSAARPNFKNLRLTADSSFWLTETYNLRFRALEDICDASRTRLRMRKEGEQLKMSRPGATYVLPKDSLSVVVGYATVHPEFMPGYTLLWKDLDVRRLEGLKNTDSGTLNIAKLASSWPSDSRVRIGDGLILCAAAGCSRTTRRLRKACLRVLPN